MELRLAAVPHLAQPPQVVEPEVVEVRTPPGQPERVSGLLEELGRRIADADHAGGGLVAQRLGDDADGVAEVHHPRPGARRSTSRA